MAVVNVGFERENLRIETTLGELICAVCDAAAEASLREEDIAKLSQHVLEQMLRRYQRKELYFSSGDAVLC